MATHMSIRLAWHSDGWNGHICKKPRENSYYIGQHSYPGNLIASIILYQKRCCKIMSEENCLIAIMGFMYSFKNSRQNLCIKETTFLGMGESFDKVTV